MQWLILWFAVSALLTPLIGKFIGGRVTPVDN